MLSISDIDQTRGVIIQATKGPAEGHQPLEQVHPGPGIYPKSSPVVSEVERVRQLVYY